jgi:ssDNA-binding Zn-finger/Zn-ribbon topoisomerase 1
MTGATLVAPLESVTPSRHRDARQTYRCPDCEHGLRVFGRGRHRVYFELGDERFGEPVMNGVCPACGQGLPGKNATGARS